MIGQRFGKLTVIEKAPAIAKRTRWICRCDCGNITNARMDALKCGDKKSCGCNKWPRSTIAEFLENATAVAVRTERGCLEYSGGRTKAGYGKVQIIFEGKKKYEMIHRIAAAVHLGYDLNDGPRTDWLVLHSCDNPPCFEVGHLFLGTFSDNMQDCVRKGRQKEIKKTHCPHGHPYSGDNLIIEKGGKRKCRTCRLSRNPLKGRRVITHCKHGHEYTAENTKIENGKRKCRTCLKERSRNRWKIHGKEWQEKRRAKRWVRLLVPRRTV